MILWTFQPSTVVNESILAAPKFQVAWNRLGEFSSSDLTAYRWMVIQMEARGISLDGHAPIWAWVCGGEGSRPPDLGTARSLLSDGQLEDGYSTVEFEAPDELVLPSLYSHFCDLLFSPLDEVPVDDSYESMFSITDADREDVNGIRATLPYIIKTWVHDVRPIALMPNEYGDHIDWETPV
jgi:hypothetical protein